MTARVAQPQTSAARRSLPWPASPTPWPPRLPRRSPRSPGLFAGIPDPTQPAAPVVERDQAAEVASLDNALNNPDFTSVFAPIDPQASRKKMAKPGRCRARHPYGARHQDLSGAANKPALDDINIEIYPGEFVFLVGHSGSGKNHAAVYAQPRRQAHKRSHFVAGQDLMKIQEPQGPVPASSDWRRVPGL